MWHRRARKTSTALEKVALEAHHPHIKNKIYWIVFPTYAEAKEAIWKQPDMLKRVIPEELIERQNEVELTIYMKSGSVISLKGADQPDRLRGSGPYGIIFDEYATMKPEAWDIMKPVIEFNKGWVWFIGTPRGKNHLYDVYNTANGRDSWYASYLKASQSGILAREDWERIRHEHETGVIKGGLPFFNQEYECEWLEGAGQVFRGVRDICTAKPVKPKDGHHYVMGVDLAKHQDYTVIAVYDRATNAQVYQQRFNKIDWPFQKAKIAEICKLFNNALIMLDATGIGDPIFDDLSRAGLPIEPFKFTQTSKKEIIEKLVIWVDQGHMKMINNADTLFEFDNYAYIMGPTGQVRYGAPVGYHDDIVTAHALAVWSLSPLYAKTIRKKRTRVQTHYDKAKRKHKPSHQEDQDIW